MAYVTFISYQPWY